jgi:acetyl-CoA carboxylase carboxyltransferase component
MPALGTSIQTGSQGFQANQRAMAERIDQLDAVLEQVRAGGGARYVERTRVRNKLLARERIEAALDPDAPFLELMPFAAWGTSYHVGAGCVVGIGVVENVECVLMAHDATVRGGAMNPHTLQKLLRGLEIADQNRLPVILFVESGGADLPAQAELFVPGGQLFRELTRLSGVGVPTVALVFGNATAGGAYMPGMCDYTVLVDGGAKVFLGGPPLVKMATGEEAESEELGGAVMHSRISGLSDYLARDELDAIRIGRQIVNRFYWHKRGRGPIEAADDPLYDPGELLGVASADLRIPFDMREVLGRVLDGSRYDEFKPLYGPALTTGWGSIHGFPVGVLGNVHGVLFSAEAQKAAQFIQLANQRQVPLLFVHNTTGFMVGREYEQGGIIKHGALMINAVSNSEVPHLGLIVGSSYGAANYAMSGRAYKPRFLFAWPNAQIAVMGKTQLAGVMSLVGRAAAQAAGRAFDEDADRAQREAVEEQIALEELALANSARGYDDGVIDPRDTRTVLGIALSVCDSAGIDGAEGFGVFRM